jgi:hypothetical protein
LTNKFTAEKISNAVPRLIKAPNNMKKRALIKEALIKDRRSSKE